MIKVNKKNLATNSHAAQGACVSLLITQQFRMFLEATNGGQENLATLMAHQLFDTLDWARVSLKRDLIRNFTTKVLSDLPTMQREINSLEQLENYVESQMITRF